MLQPSLPCYYTATFTFKLALVMSDTELEPFELVARTTKRYEILIAQFIDGFALGWAFPVPEAFREALDIRMTTKKMCKKDIQIWTQEASFSFKEGDAIHNSRLAYDNYASFLKGKNPITLQVQNATDAGFVTTESFRIEGYPVHFRLENKTGVKEKDASSFTVSRQTYDTGVVRLIEFRPTPEKDRMIETVRFELKQDEFVMLLQSGVRRHCVDNHIITDDFSFESCPK